MRSTTSFAVSAPPEPVFAVLLDPRMLVTANHPKPILEQSEPPTIAGSWAVIGLDQLRARVEYIVVEAPSRVVAHVALTGMGSLQTGATASYELRAGDAPGTTVVSVSFESEGNSIMGRLTWPIVGRTIRNRIRQAVAPA